MSSQLLKIGFDSDAKTARVSIKNFLANKAIEVTAYRGTWAAVGRGEFIGSTQSQKFGSPRATASRHLMARVGRKQDR